MGGSELAWIILASLIRHLAAVLVGGICLILAIRRRRLHPRVSKFAMVGAIGMLAIVALNLALQVTLVYFQDEFTGVSQLSALYMYFNLAIYPINLVSLVCLAVAIFIDRGSGSVAAYTSTERD